MFPKDTVEIVVENLAELFELSDLDKDGFLNLKEFARFFQMQGVSHGAGDIMTTPELTKK
jgi:Ca2+-binding EF-hand superfamily protein